MSDARCVDCGRPYGDEHGFPDLVVPHDVWAKISLSGDENGLLCPSCMCARAHRAGLSKVPAVFRSGPFCDYAETERVDRQRAALRTLLACLDIVDGPGLCDAQRQAAMAAAVFGGGGDG